jgi:hypothetical protein
MPPEPPELFPAIPQGRYCRLCPGEEWGTHDPEQLAKLAGWMKGRAPPDKATSNGELRLTMPSGYVYFGQFVDHDLTRDNTLLAQANPKAYATANFRSPRLDLEVLYGQGPSASSALYRDGERLLIGDTVAVTAPEFPHTSYESSPNDLYRDRDGNAIVIDSRNDENLIIAQMHVLWCKLHNRLLALAQEDDGLLAGVPAGSLFERVRQLVTWLYQWIVVHDFLPSFVRNDTWADVFNWRNLRLYSGLAQPSRTPFALPIEFTAAAFRFGHSMVRSEYSLRRSKVATTEELLGMTKAGGGIDRKLRADFVVDWDLFLEEKPFVNRGERIDSFVAGALYGLPGIVLPQATLLRGSKMRLPSGQEFARLFRLPVLDEKQIPSSNETAPAAEVAALFQSEGFRGRTPLWYYLLRESAVEALFERGPRSQQLPLQKLGQIGSRIVTEVFYQVLMADADSIYNAGRHWQPPRCLIGSSTTPESLNSLLKISRLVKAQA